jgi:hypothetical protein
LLPVTPVLFDIITFASAIILQCSRQQQYWILFALLGGLQEFKLEDSFLIRTLLSNPQNDSVAKDVAQKIEKFYFRDKSNSAAAFSSATDVRNNFVFCSHSIRFSMSIQLGSLTVRGKLRSTVLDSMILGGISKL